MTVNANSPDFPAAPPAASPAEGGAATSTGPSPGNLLVGEWRRILSLREMGVYYALILLVVVLSLVTGYLGKPNYLSALNLTNILYQTSLVGIVAVAMTVVLITGNFDLSVASVGALSAAVLIGTADVIGFWPAVSVSLMVAVAAGLFNGIIVQYLKINAFIVTLGSLTAIRGLVLIYTDGRSISTKNPEVLDAMKAFESGRIDIGFVVLGIGIVMFCAGLLLAYMRARRGGLLNPAATGLSLGGIVLAAIGWLGGSQLAVGKPVIYMAIFTLSVWFVLNFTNVGRRIYAVGGNPEAARLSGINVTRYRLLAFVFCSAAAGFAGILFASRLRSINPAALSGQELTVIAAAILGGTSLFGGAGSVIKTLAGALLLYTLTNGFNITNLGANYQGLIEGLVVITAAAIYTVGGNKRRSKTG
ncbi:ABC transporter permease [Devosia sp. CN2-171]|uniref:ABC transporter permease n=1 Tax=Devosia sp. CN2-171 TaxID=3400909 RepID=UPI003BF922D3